MSDAWIAQVVRTLKKYDPRPVGQQKRFAVLLPLIHHEGEWQILYEVRSHAVSQPGETSFPGGAIEPGECPSDAAIRETMEELCLAREDIEILGEMDYLINESSIIYCFVGCLRGVSPGAICAEQEEVQDVFTLSLEWLCNHPPKYYTTKIKPHYSDDFPIKRLPGGRDYPWSRRKNIVGFYDIPDSGYNLWGFTAMLTDRFIRLIKEEAVFDCGAGEKDLL